MSLSRFAMLFMILSVTNCVDYILQTQLLKWSDSESLCLFNYDQHLASIHNNTQNEEAVSVSLGNNVWFGLTDEAVEDIWIYSDNTSWDYGTRINPLGQEPWNDGEPNNNNNGQRENCAMIRALNGLWNDAISVDLKYSLCGYPKSIEIINDPLFHTNYQRIPYLSNNIGIIDVLDEIYIEFDIIIHSWHPIHYASLLHFGNTTNFWIGGPNQNKSLYTICSLINGQNVSISTSAVNLNKSYHLIYYQTQNHLTYTLDNNTIFDEDIGSHSVIMDSTIYLGSPWYDPADVTISNLIITTSNSNSPNSFFNYNCDADNRWEIISGTWSFTKSISQCTVKQTDNAFMYGAVVWLGGYDPLSINWTDYKIEIVFSIDNYQNGYGQAGMLLRSQSISATNQGQQYWFGAEYGAQHVSMGLMNDGWSPITDEPVTVSIGTIYTLRVEIRGSEFKVYWQNKWLFTEYDNNYLYGSVALRTFR